jgi:TonB-linked SusC/RagA family outer membrane protein
MQTLGKGIHMPVPKLQHALLTKMILVMRMTTILLLAACLQVSASGLAQITLQVKKASLEQVLQSIRQQSGYDLVYDIRMLREKGKPVAIEVKNASVEQVLQLVLKEQPLTYEIAANHIIYIKEKTVAQQAASLYLENAMPPGEVKGRITDEKGNAVVGALVQVKGARIAAVTNEKGEFVFQGINPDVTLVISAVNIETIEFTLRGNSPIVIMAKSKVFLLNEVAIQVNTGYQVLSKERATGSFSKPDMEIFKARTGTMNLVTRLEGLVPGLTIIPGPRVINNARGGSTSENQAVVRGSSSIQVNSDPLYVVNGIQVSDLSTINPDDVADITVLKDAAAAAIWGARAANGVIVITTKTGTRNEKMKISYSGFVNFQGKPDFDYVPVLNSRQYIQAAKETFNATEYPWSSLTSAFSFVSPHELILYNQSRGLISVAQANASLDSLANIDNTAQIRDLWYRNALITNHTLSLSGGGNAYSYYASLAYNNSRSNRPGDLNNAYRVTLNQDFQPASFIKASLNTMISNTRTAGQRNISIDNRFLPYQLFRDANGRNISMAYVQGMTDSLRNNYQSRSRISLDYNPLNEINYGYSKSNSLAANISSNIEVKLYKGLSFRGSYGFISNKLSNTSYDDSKSYLLRKELLGMTVAPSATVTPVYYLPNSGGKYAVADIEQRNWTVRNQLVYSLTGRDGNDWLNVQVGQDAQEQFALSNASVVRGYNEALQTYVALDYATLSRGISNTVLPFAGRFSETPYSKTEDRQRFVSYFALANYTLNRKYSLDASWRVDKSSLFGKDLSVQNKPVWSVGAKWTAGRENFMKRFTAINDLAIRASYGITGNSPYAGATALDDILGAEQTGNVAGPALSINVPANGKLVWEMTTTKNIGLDFSVVNRRISVGIDYYHKNTTNLLGAITLNPLSSANTAIGNLGSLVNKGLEISIKTTNLQTKSFSWQSMLVFSYNTNKLVTYTPLSPFANNASSKVNNYSYWLDHKMQPLFAYRFAGLDNLGDPMIRLTDGTVTKSRNVAKPDDVAFMGSIVPVFNGGFTNSFRYKGFSLSANMIYNLGHVMRKDVNTFYAGKLTGTTGFFQGNINSYFVNRWKTSGDEKVTNIPSYVESENIQFSRRDVDYYAKGDINVVSASYVKLRDITLSYTLPEHILGLLHISAMNVFVQSGNYMIWRANKEGIDPEFHDLATGTRRMPAFGHSFSIGANITF